MLCQICTMVQKAIITAATAEKRQRLETNYAAHLKRDHKATQAEIEARLYGPNIGQNLGQPAERETR